MLARCIKFISLIRRLILAGLTYLVKILNFETLIISL
jgi:hypothetical protein